MARRILNRKDLRADYDAAERRQQDDEGDEAEETEEETEDEDAAEGDEEKDKDEDEEEEVVVVAPKKRKPPVVKEKKPKSRSRAGKITRLKVVWGVFNNSNQRVATYEYPKRKEAEEHAAKLMADKKSTHFVQPVKEPIEEKKEG